MGCRSARAGCGNAEKKLRGCVGCKSESVGAMGAVSCCKDGAALRLAAGAAADDPAPGLYGWTMPTDDALCCGPSSDAMRGAKGSVDGKRCDESGQKGQNPDPIRFDQSPKAS
ncbi:hypothetical protein L1887_59536 [Cichorium endivia]|nr:hypothetical protein L1887_59536 [Cichorium endivia]